MFDTPKEKLLKLLLKRIEENYKIDIIYINFYHWYGFSFEWYELYIETHNDDEIFNEMSSVSKDWIEITNDKDKWFFEKLINILNWKIQENKNKIEKERKAKEKIIEQEMLSKYEEYIQELNWIQKEEWTEEFNEVMEDTKRLQEIAKEAKQIHDKYKKPFYNLFTNN